MPEYVANGGSGHMVLGRGPKGYLITLTHGGEGSRALLIVEAWAEGMIPAVAMVQELTDGEVISCVKLWV